MKTRPCNPTNRPGTCVWCGRVLFYNAQLANPRKPEISECVSSGKGGANEDDLFCDERCGYLFGLVHARSGLRLTMKRRR